MDALPVFELAPFLACTESDVAHDVLAACKRLATCLVETGCLIVRDPRVGEDDNSRFIDLLEQYWSRPNEAKLAEARPDFHYQVGATPAGTEVPRCLVDPQCAEAIQSQPEGHKATMPTGPDCKWRYMWRVGPRPQHTAFAELNAAPVVPDGLPQWPALMDCWGSKMLAAVEAAAEMAALGFGLPRDAFSSLMRLGPHLLAPTGADLQAHGQPGAVIAGYHYDLNFITIHGRSRYPGLFVWLRDGRRVPVRIPAGCLLLQAGKQLEWLTGGHVKAGMHEVVVSPATLEAVERARAEGRSTWRVSSTVFAHVASDHVLQPLGRFAEQEGACERYPATKAGEQVQAELEVISLKHSPTSSGANNNSSSSSSFGG